MTTPLVSVTIPFFNAERFLRATVESVLSQTYPHWELLLVDDGSSDSSSQIARSFAEAQPGRIVYLEHDGHRNRGVNASRNLGARSARGPILAFLDSDDIWLPCKLAEHVAELEAHPEAGFLFAPTLYWYEWNPEGNPGLRDHIPEYAPGGRVYPPPSLFAKSYPFGSYGAPCPCSFLVRREAFEQVGGFNEEFHRGTFQLYEDVAFLSKMYLNVPVYVSLKCLDRNRCSPYSMTRQKASVQQEEAARRFYCRWLRDYVKASGERNEQVLRAVSRESWYYVLPLPISRFCRRVQDKWRRLASRRLSG
ncbi:MAG: glycosyltransferase family A protein [Terracidiphilus sp.]|nr:glycosyltransferase family A protein [Terracidiphilus sp.]